MKQTLPVLLFALLLSACQPGSNQPADNNETAALEKQLAETKAELERLKQGAATSQSAKIKSQADVKVLADDASQRWKCTDQDDYECVETSPKEAPRLCWQNYCPCEDPVTSLDRTICRNAKGGIEMSNEQWAIGAQARDSKIEGDRLNGEMDSIISDMSGNMRSR